MAVAAKKTVVTKKAAPTLPEPVELTFTLEKGTTGTWKWAEEAAEDGSVVVGPLYVKKPYFNGFVPDENTVMTVTIQVDQAEDN